MSLKDALETKTTKTLTFIDYEFTYDGGIRDGFTVGEGDVVDCETPGQINVIFAPRRPEQGEKPEFLTIQTSKIISQRVKQWTREVEITAPPTPRRPGGRQTSDPTPEVLDLEAPTASLSPQAAPESSGSGATSKPRRVYRPRPAVTSPEPPAPPRPRSRRKTSSRASRLPATTDAHTSESSTDDVQKGSE